tara:strand:+ start:5371 stop:5586 length:216 start_codon:yes stop_codon:yes gene_type:complete
MNKPPPLKLKPHADRIRAQLDALPCPGIAELQFEPGDWKPSSRFFAYHGAQTGRSFSVRNHRNRTFIFRLQ